ncbi:MAG TPA: HIT domain-containing protein [Bacteroidales bacterium]|nr:HIT domain-containing protein [Bacteroidales bacterium]
MVDSIFSKIVKQEIPCYKVAENNDFLAFLDINPLEKGHTIVIPKKEIDYIFNIEDKLYKDFFVFAKYVALGIQKVIECRKVGLAVVGLEIPHAHIHLIPLNTGFEINFQKEKLKLTHDEFIKIANLISEAIVM